MIGSNYQVRRATLDDLVPLRRLWQQTQMPLGALEKRLTEFQVVETADGEVLGALGFQITGKHGKIHSEAYRAAELADELRSRLWERVLSIARNHGLCRLWVIGGTSVFWTEKDFEPAGTETLSALPEAFESDEARPWLTLKLRDESPAAHSAEKELTIFRQAQQEQSARLMRHARVLKFVAVIVTVAVLSLIVLAILAAWRGMKGPR